MSFFNTIFEKKNIFASKLLFYDKKSLRQYFYVKNDLKISILGISTERLKILNNSKKSSEKIPKKKI